MSSKSVSKADEIADWGDPGHNQGDYDGVIIVPETQTCRSSKDEARNHRGCGEEEQHACHADDGGLPGSIRIAVHDALDDLCLMEYRKKTQGDFDVVVHRKVLEE